ncbi:MAG TPA: hypothetical protein PLL69_00560 [Gemmatimonadales bacterium]|nr:hypothetical protein [Gemmatimonadales bacterium]
MSFPVLALRRTLPLLLVAACTTTEPTPPPPPGEPFSVLVNRVQGITDGSLLTALTDREGVTWLGGSIPALLFRPPGGAWSFEPLPADGVVTGLWQDDDGRILATAGYQLLARGFGTGDWEVEPIPMANSVQLLDIAGFEGGPLFLTGSAGTILRRSGGVWSPSETGVSDELWGIAGDSEHDLTAVGQNGTILESEDGGVTWHRAFSPTDRTLFAVASDGAGRLVAVGGNGMVLLRDGDTWEVTGSPTNANLFEVKSAGPRRFLIAGDDGTLFEGDGLAWEMIEGIGTRENLRAITGQAGSRVVAGWFGAVMDEAATWGTVLNGSRIYSIHDPADGNAWAVGQGGVAFERVAGAWSPRKMPGTGSYYAMAGPRAIGRIAVGDHGAVLRYDGNSWHQMAAPATELLRAVWYDGNRAVVVGEAGTALIMEGGVWRRVPSGTTGFLRDVGGRDWQHLFAVGDGGVVLRFNGEGFQLETTPTEVNLRGGVTRRNGETWMVGDEGRIYRREGSIWRIVLPPTLGDLRAVHEVDGVLYIAGAAGMAWYRDDQNENWVPITTSLPGLWLDMTGSDELLLAGEFGTIAEGVHESAGALLGAAVPAIRGAAARPVPR